MHYTQYIVHVIESFAGGSLEVVRVLTKIKKSPQDVSLQHVVIYGQRHDSPENPNTGFDNDTILIPWLFATREISVIQDFRALYALLEILKPLPKTSIIHLHSSKAGFLGRLVAVILKRKAMTIYTPHGVAMLRRDISEKKRRLYSFLEKIAALGAGYVVACSPSEQKILSSIGVKALLVANGIPDILYTIKPVNTLINVVAIGRLTEAKDPIFYVEIAKKLLDINFTWVGDGELRSVFANSPVDVTGWLSQSEVIDYLQKADVLISTSRWEGLSLATLQAMACGLPLLLRRCAGNIDLLEHQGIGAGFDTVDEAVSILKSWQQQPELVQQMSLEARKVFLQHYTLQSMQMGYLNIYQSIMSSLIQE